MLMFLKKFFSRLLFPLPLGIELLVIGFILWRFTRRKRLGQVLVALGTVWMAIIGYSPIPRLLLPGLTEQYPPVSDARMKEAKPSFIVVPGMGVHTETGYPANLRFPTEFILRLLEAARVHRLCPEAQILVSISNSNMTEAEKRQVLDGFMNLLQVDPAKVTLLIGLGDTEEEIQEFQRRSGGKLVCVVSAAAHLPRAMIFARRHGLNALASPSSRGGIPPDPNRRREFSVVDIFPNAECLGDTELVFYEYLGLTLERVKGALRAAKEKAVNP